MAMRLAHRSAKETMNVKAEQHGSLGAADIGKLVLATLVLLAGLVGYYELGSLPHTVRTLGVVATTVIAIGIAAFTVPGRAARAFLAESQLELRKVVWPTRDETVRTTVVIAIVVVIISIVLGLIDVVLKWAILDHLLKIGN